MRKIYEDSINDYKERMSILTEGTKESDLLHDINSSIRKYIREELKVKLNSGVGWFRNNKFKNKESDYILISFDNVAGDILFGAAIGLICPIIPINHISAKNLTKLHGTLECDQLQKYLNDLYGDRCTISELRWYYNDTIRMKCIVK